MKTPSAPIIVPMSITIPILMRHGFRTDEIELCRSK
jgi:hypothetical protein